MEELFEIYMSFLFLQYSTDFLIEAKDRLYLLVTLPLMSVNDQWKKSQTRSLLFKYKYLVLSLIILNPFFQFQSSATPPCPIVNIRMML